jgi:hypothetical protein
MKQFLLLVPFTDEETEAEKVSSLLKILQEESGGIRIPVWVCLTPKLECLSS